MHLNRDEINRRWVRKYGLDYSDLVDLSEVDKMKPDFCDDGIKYYKEDRVIDIEKCFSFEHEEEVKRLTQKDRISVYKLIYIDGYEIHEVCKELYIDEEDAIDFIDILESNCYNDVLKLYFIEHNDINAIAAKTGANDDHIISIIVRYLKLFGVCSYMDIDNYRYTKYRHNYVLVCCDNCNSNWFQRDDRWNKIEKEKKKHLCIKCRYK